MIELCLDRGVHLLPIELALEQLPVHVGFRPHPSGSLEVAPGGLLRGGRSPSTLPGPPELEGHLLHVPHRKGQLLPLGRQLHLQHLYPLPVPHHELLGDLHRFGIGNLGGETAAPLGILQLLAFGRKATLGRSQGVPHGGHGHLGVHDCGVEQGGTMPGIARRGMVGEELLEPGLEPFKHRAVVPVEDWPNGTDRPKGRQGSGRVSLWDMRRLLPLLPLLALASCGPSRAGGACGLTAIAGATMLLQEFAVPEQTLGEPPLRLPPRLVARVAVGPAYAAVVGRTPDSAWVIGIDGTLPRTIKPGFGVLVLDKAGKARGVMVYESDPIRGAPPIGKLAVDSLMLPLLAIQLDPARIEDPRCPLFPDSLLQ